MKHLLEKLMESLAEDEHARVLCESITGTINSQEIAITVDTFCQRNLGSEVEKCLSLEFSVGAAIGLELKDGRQIFIKIHREDVDCWFLNAMSQVQSYLCNQGFPCPEVLLPPQTLFKGTVTVDRFCVPGQLRDAHTPAIRREMANRLAELITLANPYQNLSGIKKAHIPKSLWPPPHNVLFDFEKTKKGAEWIDAIAVKAKQKMAEIHGTLVLGHQDWSVKHFRFAGDKTAIIYDWDSLIIDDELSLVGTASVHFPTTWYIDTKLTPSPEESECFINEYEQAREVPFTKLERDRIHAAAIYGVCYTSRCEHAIDEIGNNYDGSFRQLLHLLKQEQLIRL